MSAAAVRILGLGALFAAATFCSPVQAADTSSKAETCASSARAKSLSGAARTAFEKRCLQSPMPPPQSNLPKPVTESGKHVVEPSGRSVAGRSAACSAEADRRKLSQNDRKAFRMSCLSGVAPVGATESPKQAERPTSAKSDIGEVKDGKQK